MLRAMETNRGENGARTNPLTESPPVSSSSRLFGGRRGDDRFENPSLERYTDLRFEDRPRGHRRWVVAIAIMLLAMFLGVLAVMAAIYAQARNDEAREVDAIVVMGAAQYNGRPSSVLAARLDHALTLYQDGYAQVIIVTGGKMEGDVYTEAGVSEQYLLDRGVPRQAIFREDDGTDTWESMQAVGRIAEGREIDTVLIVSDGFHLFRSDRMAGAVGLEAYTSAAPDSPIRPWTANEFSYVIRETGAVILQMPDWLF
jgi:uncharacterized SAM-binding protein YcdF (DUF218 family)